MTKGIFIMFVLLLLLGIGIVFFGLGSSSVVQRSPGFVSVPEDSLGTTSSPVTTSPGGGVVACKKTGCSSQVCAEEDVITDCMYREEYMCYQKARCERQDDGKCGWTLTPEISVCLTQYE